jgi:NADH-quinone oxidoreductase subunit N
MPGSSFIPPAAEILRFLPELILTVMATLLMVLEPVTSRSAKRAFPLLSLVALAAALVASVSAQSDPGFAFSNMLLMDGFGSFFRALILVVGMLAVMISGDYLRKESAECGEYYALLIFSVVGQCLMVTADDLIMLFIGLEVSSIATYILAGFLRDDRRNNESALKYFLLGSFATAFFLYGIAWIYGVTGETNLPRIRSFILSPGASEYATLLGLAAGLMLVGLAFKVSAAPFQMWTPDVYQGAPAPVSAFMSAGPKAAAFAMFLRIFMTAFEPMKSRWEPLVWASALATMVIGNFAALRQTNVKRLLAYSSIAHAGYVMVAVTSQSEIGTAAAMFYLVAYAFMNLGAFAMVTHVARKGERFVEIEDLAGLSQRQPVAAALFTIFLLSLVGVPLTGGFFAKFYVFKAALDSNLVWLTVLGLLTSAVAAFYYLRLIVVMYMHAPSEAAEPLPPMASGIRVALFAAAFATIFLGIFPGPILDWAGRSASLLR